MSRLEDFREKQRIKKEKEIEEFLNSVNKLENNLNNITLPMINIKKEYNDKFINYHITKYPNCLRYSLSFYKKEYPFELYYSKDFYKNDIPKKYLKDFEELEKIITDYSL